MFVLRLANARMFESSTPPTRKLRLVRAIYHGIRLSMQEVVCKDLICSSSYALSIAPGVFIRMASKFIHCSRIFVTCRFPRCLPIGYEFPVRIHGCNCRRIASGITIGILTTVTKDKSEICAIASCMNTQHQGVFQTSLLN